jgi:hypothetical protein
VAVHRVLEGRDAAERNQWFNDNDGVSQSQQVANLVANGGQRCTLHLDQAPCIVHGVDPVAIQRDLVATGVRDVVFPELPVQ